ncbi:MAG: Ig-like domain-containing protein [Prevotella sp.]|nr:Ig-like domain-containing protein [Prevotella sp.]
MKKLLRVFLTMVCLVGLLPAHATFKDIRLDLTGGNFFTDAEITDKSSVSFGIAIADDGSATRVATDDASANIVLSGKYHSDEHGWGNFSAKVAVEGPVKISMGTCAWGGDVTIKDAGGNVVGSFNTNNGTCYHQNKTDNIASTIYKGEATTLTISGGNYTPYIAVEAVDPGSLVESKTATFSLGNDADCGVAPAAITADEGTAITIPGNFTVYKEGYTLTGWTDGSNTVALGTEYTLSDNVTLTPVFTQNSKTLADRTEAVTLTWDFQRKNGAPTVGYQNATGIWVTQANIAGETIDVKIDFDTNNGGKIANDNWTDWCQMNGGTKFTIPSAKGAVVSMEAYGAITTTTIDGQSDYTSGNTISYAIASSAETIDIVIGDGSYYRYIKTVIPVVEQGGKTYTDEAVSVVYAMSDINNPGECTSTTNDVFSTLAFDSGDATLTGTAIVTMTDGTTTDVKGIKFKPAGSTKNLTWFVRPAMGLTFTPTRVEGYINRCGTDSEKGVTVSAKKTDGTEVALGTYTAWRQGKSSSSKDYDREAVYKYDITLTAEQQAQLAGTDGFYLYATIGVSSAKEGLFGKVTIDGTVNGTMVAVNKYALTLVANTTEGGEVSVYPKSDEYLENDEVQLTATENFGYDFVNWTNAAGEEVSTDAKFKYIITADETLTANFKQVNTYALDFAVEGGANDYMVSLSPASTVVDGKNMYEEGTKVVMSASSNPILTFTNWSNGETAAEMAVTMNEDKSFVASYAAIDYIAGWDFIRPGNAGRAADFAAADNDAASIVMLNEAGESKGWLDKSQQAAGGYEGRPGAVCWVAGSANGDVGHHHWQTCVNASAFTDIKVITSMVYNYNAYPTQSIEYSLDGETWTSIGKITIEGAKKWTDGTFSLPADANNKDKVYIRWISDKTSTVNGSASANDGITLGGTYIIGTAQLIDDGTAPVLVSSVPENGATGASANGKVVLTFDEKVKLTDAAKATIGDLELAMTASGKTVICEYKGLNYSTDYQFKLTAGSVSDLTDNANAADIVINFQTKVKPAVTKGTYDFIVPIDGTITEALAAANARGTNATERYRILILNGNYVFDTNGTTTGGDGKTYPDPRSYLNSPYVSFIGQSMEGVVITNQTPDATWDNGFGQACPLEGIGNGDVLIINKDGHDAYFQNLTMKSSMGDAHGRDIVLNDKSNRTVFKDACLWGYQDTYVSNNQSGKFYFEGGVLRGRTDYLCGKGDVYYNEVTLQQCGAGGYLAVPSQAKNYGYVFQNCYIKKETSDVTFYLGRPWGSGTPTASFINTKMDTAPIGNGWADMSGGWPKRFAEYNSYLTSGTTLDLSGRRTSWTDKEGTQHDNDPILTIDEVQAMSLDKVMGQDDDWDPTALTEQASAPTDVVINTDTKMVTWDNSDYVFCWVIFKDGVYVANTTVPSYEVDDASATWSVRAANEMGGLSEATTATLPTAIDAMNASAVKSVTYYNLQGIKVNKTYKGTVIKIETLANGKKVITKVN